MSEQSLTNSVDLAFFDMETTGLDANTEVPLETGIILTDIYGHEIASYSWLIWEFTPTYRDAANNCVQFVKDMHDKSGLWNDLADLEFMARHEADASMVKFLERWGVKPQSREDDFDGIGMTGNSIGSLDRPFALVHFPKLNAYLGYRNIDLSSFKEVCKRTNRALYENLKPIIGTKADADHRVLGDCRAAIREYQAYLDNFIITGDEI